MNGHHLHRVFCCHRCRRFFILCFLQPRYPGYKIPDTTLFLCAEFVRQPKELTKVRQLFLPVTLQRKDRFRMQQVLQFPAEIRQIQNGAGGQYLP